MSTNTYEVFFDQFLKEMPCLTKRRCFLDKKIQYIQINVAHRFSKKIKYEENTHHEENLVCFVTADGSCHGNDSLCPSRN
jgi:hypothetical protein